MKPHFGHGVNRLMSNITKAITIAASVHENQVDKSGADYILHPLRVMMRMQSDETRIVAVLHDVIEDSSEDDAWTPKRLIEEGFTKEIVDAVDCLTKREGESYEGFIERLSNNNIARLVKIADLEDNMNVVRLRNMDEVDIQRLKKYHVAWLYLRQK